MLFGCRPKDVVGHFLRRICSLSTPGPISNRHRDGVILILVPLLVAIILQPWVRLAFLHAFDFQRWVEVIGLSFLVLLVLPSTVVVIHRKPCVLLFVIFSLLLLCVAVGQSSAPAFLWVSTLRSVLYAITVFGFALAWRNSGSHQKAWFSGVFFGVLLMYCAYLLVGSFSLLLNRVYDKTLAVSGFSNINHAAGFIMLSLLLLPGLKCLLSGYGRQYAVSIRALGVALTFVLTVIGSRGALLACVMPVGVLLFFHRRRAVGEYLRWLLGTFAIALLVYLVFRVVLFGLHIDFFVGGKTLTSDSGRFDLFLSAWRGALDSPWLGHGPLSYAALPAVHLGHAHNVFLTLLYEYGFPITLGVVASCLLVAYLIWKGRAAVVKNPVGISGTAALIGFAVHAQFSGLLMIPATMLMLLVACAFVANAIPQRIPIVRLSYYKSVAAWLAGVLLVSAYLFLVLQYWQVVDIGVSQKPRFWIQGGTEAWFPESAD